MSTQDSAQTDCGDNRRREDASAEQAHDRQASPEVRRQQPPPNLFERVISWGSLLLLFATAAFLVRETLQREVPPSFETSTRTVRAAQGRYYLPVVVENTGGQSVQNLQLRVELREGADVVATAEGALEWLPAHSQREVVVIFDRDPQRYRVVVVLEGYERP